MSPCPCVACAYRVRRLAFTNRAPGGIVTQRSAAQRRYTRARQQMAQRGAAHGAEATTPDALVAALLMLARDSADALQAHHALRQLVALLECAEGARLSAGASDVFSAVLAALRRHPSDATTQHAGALLLGRIAQNEAEPSETPGGAAGVAVHRFRLNPGRPAPASQRVDALRAVAAAARLLAADEDMFDVCCLALLALGNDVRDADADVVRALTAAMRARPDCGAVQHAAVEVLHKCCAAGEFTLRAEVLSCTVAALRRSDDQRFALKACVLLRELVKDTEVAKLFDRSGFEALVGALQVQNGWTEKADASSLVYVACKVMYAAMGAAYRTAAEQAVEAGAVPRLVALLRSAVGSNWTAEFSKRAISNLLMALSRICDESRPAAQLVVDAGGYEPLVRVMRSIPDDAATQDSACRIMHYCCFPDSLSWLGTVANVAAAMEAGAPAVVLAAHAAHGERNELTDQSACCALGAFLAGRQFAMATAYHRRVADALLASMRRRPSTRILQRACCWALAKLCPEVSVEVHRSMLDAGLVELLTQVVHQFGTSSEAKDAVTVLGAVLTLRNLLHSDGVAVAQQALHAGAVEACLLAAASTLPSSESRADAFECDLGSKALIPLCMMTERLPAATARAAACGAYRLAAPLEAVFPASLNAADYEALVHRADFQAMMQELRRSGDLARDHVACGDAACDMCCMSRTRCSLPSCAARNGDSGVAFKRCGRCNCANFCCKEHQVSAWPRHKPLCRVRAAVEEARRELLAQSGADADASN